MSKETGTGAVQGHPVRRWPLFFIASPAAVAVWSGWVGLGTMAGFGIVHPLPGIVPGFEINTAITLPVGVEAYGAYALGAWLAPGAPPTARKFARRSAIGALFLGMTGQAVYHLLAAAHDTRAPWLVVLLVSCLPVVTLGFGAALTHLLRAGSHAPTSAPAVPARRAAGSAGATSTTAEAAPPTASAVAASPALTASATATPQKQPARSEAGGQDEAGSRSKAVMEAAPFPAEAKQQRGSGRAPASPANVTTLAGRSNEAIAAEAREAEASEDVQLKTRDIQARWRVSPTRACKILRLLRDGDGEAATGSEAVQ